jgi:protein tyrosine phosphatase
MLQNSTNFNLQVWQEKVAVIVMLCQLIENNKQKADLYWPYDQHQSVSSIFNLKHTKIKTNFVNLQFENSGLKITNNGVNDEPDKQMRTTRITVRGRSSRTGEIRFVIF